MMKMDLPLKFVIVRTTALFLMMLILAGATGFGQTVDNTDHVNIIAHRGGTTERPENTLSAYKRAIEQGADMLEIDVRTSSDSILFILHDALLDRTTDGSGTASALTMEELSRLDAGSWFDSTYATERIPSFREVLTWAKSDNVTLLLDLKESGQAYAERVAAEINEYGTPSKMVIGVRSIEQAIAFRDLLPHAQQLGFIHAANDIEAYVEAGVDVIRLWLSWLEKEPLLAKRVHATGVKLMVNGTVGELDETKTIMEFSPDWILINDPAQLIKSLLELNNRIPRL